MPDKPWTPGPWNNVKDDFIEAGVSGIVVVDQINNDLGEFRDEEITGNANLIAAAPDLYDALERLVAATESADNPGDMGVSGHDDTMVAARAALAKARGEAAMQSRVDPKEEDEGSTGLSGSGSAE